VRLSNYQDVSLIQLVRIYVGVATHNERRFQFRLVDRVFRVLPGFLGKSLVIVFRSSTKRNNRTRSCTWAKRIFWWRLVAAGHLYPRITISIHFECNTFAFAVVVLGLTWLTLESFRRTGQRAESNHLGAQGTFDPFWLLHVYFHRPRRTCLSYNQPIQGSLGPRWLQSVFLSPVLLQFPLHTRLTCYTRDASNHYSYNQFVFNFLL